jgi:hypothetical protein
MTNDQPLTVTIKELAFLLQTSIRTIELRMKAGAFPIPEIRAA